MTLATTDSRIQYSPNGVTVNFAFPYYFLSGSHLQVIETSILDVDTVKVLDTDYTVTGAGVLSGGTVVFGVAPTSGTRITITRIVPVTQLLDYIANDAFPAETHELGLDKLTMICQQLALNANYGRAITVPASEPISTNLILPLDRENTVLIFDADGNVSTTDLATLIATIASTVGSNFSVGVVTGTSTIKSCTFHLDGTGPFKIRVWIVTGSPASPTIIETIQPPDGNLVTNWDVLTDGGDAVVTLEHNGASATWKVCAECQGVVIMSPAFTIGA